MQERASESGELSVTKASVGEEAEWERLKAGDVTGVRRKNTSGKLNVDEVKVLNKSKLTDVDLNNITGVEQSGEVPEEDA
jgi:ssDNA-binding replication factor A large subunit